MQSNCWQRERPSPIPSNDGDLECLEDTSKYSDALSATGKKPSKTATPPRNRGDGI